MWCCYVAPQHNVVFLYNINYHNVMYNIVDFESENMVYNKLSLGHTRIDDITCFSLRRVLEDVINYGSRISMHPHFCQNCYVGGTKLNR